MRFCLQFKLICIIIFHNLPFLCLSPMVILRLRLLSVLWPCSLELSLSRTTKRWGKTRLPLQHFPEWHEPLAFIFPFSTMVCFPGRYRELNLVEMDMSLNGQEYSSSIPQRSVCFRSLHVNYLNHEIKDTLWECGQMTQWIRALTVLMKDPRLIHSNHIRQLRTDCLPVTPAPLDLKISPSHQGHLPHIWQTHRDRFIYSVI